MKRLSTRFKTRVKSSTDPDDGSSVDSSIVEQSTKLLQEGRKASARLARSQSPMARLSSNLAGATNADGLSPTPSSADRRSRAKPRVSSANPLFTRSVSSTSRSSRSPSRSAQNTKVKLQSRPLEPEPTGPPTKVSSSRTKLKTANPLYEGESDKRGSRRFGMGLPSVGFNLPSVPVRHSGRAGKGKKESKQSKAERTGKQKKSRSIPQRDNKQSMKSSTSASSGGQAKAPQKANVQNTPTSKRTDSAPPVKPPIVQEKPQETMSVKKYQHGYRINDSNSYYYQDDRKPRRRMRQYVGEQLVADCRG